MPSITRHPEPRFEQPPASPWAWVRDWLEVAAHADLREPTAMNLATVSRAGQPSNRMVLFKGWHGDQICFYTNSQGRKGQELATTALAALCFWWDALDRQIRLEGRIARLPAAISDAYFASRSRGSQLGAWASAQSQPVSNRAELQQRFAEVESRFAGQTVPRPPHWHGYGLDAVRVELWQGQPDRFHDRMLYARDAASAWSAQRLQP